MGLKGEQSGQRGSGGGGGGELGAGRVRTAARTRAGHASAGGGHWLATPSGSPGHEAAVTAAGSGQGSWARAAGAPFSSVRTASRVLTVTDDTETRGHTCGALCGAALRAPPHYHPFLSFPGGAVTPWRCRPSETSATWGGKPSRAAPHQDTSPCSRPGSLPRAPTTRHTVLQPPRGPDRLRAALEPEWLPTPSPGPCVSAQG